LGEMPWFRTSQSMQVYFNFCLASRCRFICSSYTARLQTLYIRAPLPAFPIDHNCHTSASVLFQWRYSKHKICTKGKSWLVDNLFQTAGKTMSST
jgi:hypothetical protein